MAFWPFQNPERFDNLEILSKQHLSTLRKGDEQKSQNLGLQFLKEVSSSS
jgi:hypothetical protein